VAWALQSVAARSGRTAEKFERTFGVRDELR